jgi:hypothetical protein
VPVIINLFFINSVAVYALVKHVFITLVTIVHTEQNGNTDSKQRIIILVRISSTKEKKRKEMISIVADHNVFYSFFETYNTQLGGILVFIWL